MVAAINIITNKAAPSNSDPSHFVFRVIADFLQIPRL